MSRELNQYLEKGYQITGGYHPAKKFRLTYENTYEQYEEEVPWRMAFNDRMSQRGKGAIRKDQKNFGGDILIGDKIKGKDQAPQIYYKLPIPSAITPYQMIGSTNYEMSLNKYPDGMPKNGGGGGNIPQPQAVPALTPVITPDGIPVNNPRAPINPPIAGDISGQLPPSQRDPPPGNRPVPADRYEQLPYRAEDSDPYRYPNFRNGQASRLQRSRFSDRPVYGRVNRDEYLPDNKDGDDGFGGVVGGLMPGRRRRRRPRRDNPANPGDQPPPPNNPGNPPPGPPPDSPDEKGPGPGPNDGQLKVPVKNDLTVNDPVAIGGALDDIKISIPPGVADPDRTRGIGNIDIMGGIIDSTNDIVDDVKGYEPLYPNVPVLPINNRPLPPNVPVPVDGPLYPNVPVLPINNQPLPIGDKPVPNPEDADRLYKEFIAALNLHPAVLRVLGTPGNVLTSAPETVGFYQLHLLISGLNAYRDESIQYASLINNLCDLFLQSTILLNRTANSVEHRRTNLAQLLATNYQEIYQTLATLPEDSIPLNLIRTFLDNHQEMLNEYVRNNGGLPTPMQPQPAPVVGDGRGINFSDVAQGAAQLATVGVVGAGAYGAAVATGAAIGVAVDIASAALDTFFNGVYYGSLIGGSMALLYFGSALRATWQPPTYNGTVERSMPRISENGIYDDDKEEIIYGDEALVNDLLTAIDLEKNQKQKIIDAFHAPSNDWRQSRPPIPPKKKKEGVDKKMAKDPSNILDSRLRKRKDKDKS